MLGAHVRSFGSESKMGKSSWRMSSSSGTVHQDKNLQDRNIEPESLKIESSSCQCSMTSNGHREEIQKYVFQIPNKSRNTRRDSREDTLVILQSWRRKEMVWNYQLYTWKRMGFHSHSETDHPKMKSVSAVSRGLLKRITETTKHFSADVSNTELFFRTVHSANQLSIYGAAPSWWEEFGLRPWANTQSMFRRVLCLRKRRNECWADLQTLAMRRVRIATWQMVSCPSDAKRRIYWEESVTWRCDELWRDEYIKLSKEDYGNSTQWKRPLPGRPNYWKHPFTRFLGDACTEAEGLQHVDWVAHW